jgi:CBS domain-containing protein
MRELGAESVPVRGNDGRMRGVISRDRVVRSIAAGADPKTVTAGETLRLVPEPPAAAAAIGVSQLLAEGVSMVPAARSGHRYRQAASLAG